MNYWSFRKLVSIEDCSFNNTLERFYNLGIDGLVRENIQNSLDGKRTDLKAPVKVVIETGMMNASDVPGIDEVRKHIGALRGQNFYTRETIQHMQECMNASEIYYMSSEDRNTKGLTGAERGENFQKDDTWGVYAYKRGYHFEEDDSELEDTRGGSHGIGKIASNAASDINMMFFCNCDAERRQHIGGNVQLIEHTLNGTTYRASGYFTKVGPNDMYYPFENNQFNPVFSKKTRGLKIVIPFLREQFRDEKKVIKAVCDNFFVAILEKKLEVEINGKHITNATLLDYVNDGNIYEEQNPEDIKTDFTPLYLATYLGGNPVPIEITDKNEEAYTFNLFFKYDEAIKKGRTAIIRGIGMKIEDKKITNYVNAPYNAVLIPNSSKEDAFLKSLENEAHTKLSFEHIKDLRLQENAKRFINNINRRMQEIIGEMLSAQNHADGKINTEEVIYTTDVGFRKEMAHNVVTVQLSKGNSEKTIVKVKSGTKSTKREKKKKEKDNKLKSLVKKLTGQNKKDQGDGKEKERPRYDMQPEAVKRIVLNSKELLSFDFTQVDGYSDEKVCDVSMQIIDGNGDPKEGEFDTIANYATITDKNNGRSCKVSQNKIKNVTIKDGVVQLEMKTTDAFNDSLKFMYYVEV